MKTEPDVYSWQTLCAKGRGCWDGVRNYTARNFMREMEVGDQVLIYHSNIGKEAVGIAQVVATAYPDPTAEGDRWSAVDVAPLLTLNKPVTLAQLRAEYGVPGPLQDLRLFRENRLSVVPLSAPEWRRVLQLAETEEPTLP